MEKKQPHKSIYLLPNMITTLSMFFGFLSIIWAIQGRYESAGLAVLIAALMDSLDGKVARLTNTTSDFGVQYDSLSDLVAFGLAPAVLLWQWQLKSFDSVGMAAAFIYTACGALRLARFNITTVAASKRFFIGLPIPAGGCTVVCFIFFAAPFTDFLQPALPWMSLVLSVCAGTLMISSVRYFSFKEYDVLRAHPLRVMLIFLFLLAFVVSYPRVMAFLLCLVYIAGGLVYSFVMLPRRNRQLLRALTPQKD
ncbi:MAG: CDP-diacylglycerol--serine O-phosphatidyltransferase [Desulfovibrio sp.]|jgi:CDP-diacylglycerol--serine O-phosphatidyltransferase|nr:CDP-diacylglycerol--serine O-phosphatidyltransferase [Desulfovibrio sp.]